MTNDLREKVREACGAKHHDTDGYHDDPTALVKGEGCFCICRCDPFLALLESEVAAAEQRVMAALVVEQDKSYWAGRLVAAAREEQRREDCAAVCAVCALGSVPIRYEAWCGTGDWRHVNMPLLVECMAGQIHERTHAAESARGGECTHDR